MKKFLTLLAFVAIALNFSSVASWAEEVKEEQGREPERPAGAGTREACEHDKGEDQRMSREVGIAVGGGQVRVGIAGGVVPGKGVQPGGLHDGIDGGNERGRAEHQEEA